MSPEPTEDRPLVTFMLVAYNQEDYVREAIEGAFAQTYEPLEIILSDDRSTDRTFEIMQEMAVAYRGPHRVIARQCLQNRGIIGHLVEAARVASGDIVVVAAGDDVSIDSRTSIVADLMLSDSRTKAVFSRIGDIEDAFGSSRSSEIHTVSVYEMVLNGGGVGKGAAYAYDRSCFFWSGDLPVNLYSEDRLLPLRAALIGKVKFLETPLVRCRKSEDSLGQLLVRERRLPSHLPEHVNEVGRTLRYACQENVVSLGTCVSMRTLHATVRFLNAMKKSRGYLGSAIVRVVSRNILKSIQWSFNMNKPKYADVL